MKPRSLLLGLDLLVILQSLYYYPKLGPTIASHFDAAGQPNGWSPRAPFFLIQLFVAALITVIFLGVPSLLRRVPASLINLPHKEYWLATERRESTFADLEDRLCWFGVATLALVLVVFRLAIAANLGSSQRIASNVVWPILGIYVAVALFLTIGLIVRYARGDRP